MKYTKNNKKKYNKTKKNKTKKMKGSGIKDVMCNLGEKCKNIVSPKTTSAYNVVEPIAKNKLPDVAYKYTFGEKRKEIVPQLTSIAKGVKEGYGIGGIGGWTDFAWDNGGKEYLITIPLSSIILWHPVRGHGEREQAGKKTTSRANNTYNALINSLVTYSRMKPLTYSQLNTIPEMASDDIIKICPININTNEEKINEIKNLSQEIINLNEIMENPSISDFVKRKTNREFNRYLTNLQNLLYTSYDQYFLVLSGQGRLQAIIEAVKKAQIPPDKFFIKLNYKNIYLDICNVLLKIHNSWVKDGDFNDMEGRHEVYFNGEYIPMSELPLAFSCERDRSKNTTLCYAKYITENVRSKNMGCSDVYNYKKPWARTFTT